jgi:ligand-binding SRPBCC domain-containing protein
VAVYSLKRLQQIPAPLPEVWNFFSSAANLQAITPPDMNFRIISKLTAKDGIYAGQLIEYKISPIMGIPLYWMTEITYVKEQVYFVDEQRFGPYRMWHHQHHFKEITGGVEMTDIVHYKNPFWVIGDIANSLFVKNKLEKIFEYRRRKIEELFGKWEHAK